MIYVDASEIMHWWCKVILSEGWFCTLCQGTLGNSWKHFCFLRWGKECYWSRLGILDILRGKPYNSQNSASTARHYQSQNVNSAKAEKFWCRFTMTSLHIHFCNICSFIFTKDNKGWQSYLSFRAKTCWLMWVYRIVAFYCTAVAQLINCSYWAWRHSSTLLVLLI